MQRISLTLFLLTPVDGGLWAWGRGSDGQLGVNTINNCAVPQRITQFDSGPVYSLCWTTHIHAADAAHGKNMLLRENWPVIRLLWIGLKDKKSPLGNVPLDIIWLVQNKVLDTVHG